MQEGAQDFIGSARINIVGAEQEEALRAAAVFTHHVFHRRNRLLVWRRAGIEHVRRHLFTFVLYRVEQQAVQLFKYRQYRFTRYRRPAAEYHCGLILAYKLARLFGEQRPVRGRINHHRFQLFAQHAAFGVDFINGHQRYVF